MILGQDLQEAYRRVAFARVPGVGRPLKADLIQRPALEGCAPGSRVAGKENITELRPVAARGLLRIPELRELHVDEVIHGCHRPAPLLVRSVLTVSSYPLPGFRTIVLTPPLACSARDGIAETWVGRARA